ncbi:ribonuclease P protein subunit p29 [Coniella lustricola]|uniref:Ribonuclease P protein subunit n=1 Tax=Coniella lustricola TaxID=2025994 RepID=A0A2T2ZSK1_9PEZI|nr:ribonuclease P protein subunit p29 [Coniella lustricola]
MAFREPSTTQALLARAHSPTSAERIFSDKIQHRSIFLRPTSPPPQETARQARRKERERKEKKRKKALKPKPLSANQRRKLGLYKVPREGQQYATFVPLHQLWLGYVREILGSEVYTGGQGAAIKLSAADFHGAEIEVARSACTGRVGIKGIVIKDTRFTFEVITAKNTIKIVPKEGTMFRVEVPPPDAPQPAPDSDEAAAQTPTTKSLVFEILGDQFSVRPADRANRKFKQHFFRKI